MSDLLAYIVSEFHWLNAKIDAHPILIIPTMISFYFTSRIISPIVGRAIVLVILAVITPIAWIVGYKERHFDR